MQAVCEYVCACESVREYICACMGIKWVRYSFKVNVRFHSHSLHHVVGGLYQFVQQRGRQDAIVRAVDELGGCIHGWNESHT